MKHLSGLVAGFALLASAGVMAAEGAANVVGAANQPAVQQGQVGKMNKGDDGKGGERSPEMRRALRTLEKANDFLGQAAKDYDGHRAKAKDLVDKAIQEVKAGLEFEDKDSHK